LAVDSRPQFQHILLLLVFC